MKNDFGLIRVYNGLGFVALKIGDLLDALGKFDQAIELALALDDKKGLILLYGNVGETFMVLENYTEAIKYFNKVADLQPKKSIKALVLESLGSCYRNLGENKKALDYLKEALALTADNNLTLVSHILTSLGTTYEAMGELEEGIKISYEAKKIANQAKIPRYEGDACLTLARLFLRKNENNKARDHLQKTLKIGTEVNDLTLKIESTKYLSDLEKEEGKWEEAYNYFLGHYQEMEKRANEKTAKEIQRLKLNEANREIELLTKSHQQISRLSQMGKEITSSLDLEEISFTIYNILADLMEVTMFGIGLYDEKKNEILVQLAVENQKKLKPTIISLDRKDSFAVRCFLDNQVLVINDAHKEYSKYVKKIASSKNLQEDGIQSLLYIPLEVSNKLIGVLTVQSTSKNAYDEYKLEMVKALASYIAIAVENSNLYERVQKMASLDTVTNLYNRAHFINLAEKEFKKFKRKQLGFSLIMFDLDHFKKINDRYGHDVGDITLRHVAYICKERLRESDLFSRYGGDEFMILLAQTELEGARVLAENLLKIINNSAISLENDQTFSLTASFGITSVQEKDLSLKDTLKRVDLALYQAKNSGRNRVSSS